MPAVTFRLLAGSPMPDRSKESSQTKRTPSPVLTPPPSPIPLPPHTYLPTPPPFSQPRALSLESSGVGVPRCPSCFWLLESLPSQGQILLNLHTYLYTYLFLWSFGTPLRGPPGPFLVPMLLGSPRARNHSFFFFLSQIPPTLLPTQNVPYYMSPSQAKKGRKPPRHGGKTYYDVQFKSDLSPGGSRQRRGIPHPGHTGWDLPGKGYGGSSSTSNRETKKEPSATDSSTKSGFKKFRTKMKAEEVALQKFLAKKNKIKRTPPSVHNKKNKTNTDIDSDKDKQGPGSTYSGTSICSGDDDDEFLSQLVRNKNRQRSIRSEGDTSDKESEANRQSDVLSDEESGKDADEKKKRGREETTPPKETVKRTRQERKSDKHRNSGKHKQRKYKKHEKELKRIQEENEELKEKIKTLEKELEQKEGYQETEDKKASRIATTKYINQILQKQGDKNKKELEKILELSWAEEAYCITKPGWPQEANGADTVHIMDDDTIEIREIDKTFREYPEITNIADKLIKTTEKMITIENKSTIDYGNKKEEETIKRIYIIKIPRDTTLCTEQIMTTIQLILQKNKEDNSEIRLRVNDTTTQFIRNRKTLEYMARSEDERGKIYVRHKKETNKETNTSDETETRWSKIVKRNIKKQDTIIIQKGPEETSFQKLIHQITESVNPAELGIKINKLTKTQEGNVKVIINSEENDKIDKFRKEIEEKTKLKTETVRNTKTLIIKDLNLEATNIDIHNAITKKDNNIDTETIIKIEIIEPKNEDTRRTKHAFVEMLEEAAKILIHKKRITVL
ncbi:hypothetical protein ABEB36_015693 [Hypothenemus hampei]|uniref:Uncharacterized protein n=1 Tax=Hypothenemus hampei TaxID=57062 RepID=A0ABD1DZB0_HYPHA